MHTYRIVWEDEPKAREVEILVQYRLDAGEVRVDAINPIRVSLFADRTPHPTRIVPVHTATGRRLLAEAYLAARETSQTLEEEILAAHGPKETAHWPAPRTVGVNRRSRVGLLEPQTGSR